MKIFAIASLLCAAVAVAQVDPDCDSTTASPAQQVEKPLATTTTTTSPVADTMAAKPVYYSAQPTTTYSRRTRRPRRRVYYRVRPTTTEHQPTHTTKYPTATQPTDATTYEYKTPEPTQAAEPESNYSYGAPTQAASPDNVNDTLVCLVNKVRARGGLPPLSTNAAIASVAYAYSARQASAGTMSHDLGGDTGDRLAAGGIDSGTWAENIAAGQKTAEDVMESWVTSPGHYKNIMNSSVKFLGCGEVDHYWTQVFAGEAGRDSGYIPTGC